MIDLEAQRARCAPLYESGTASRRAPSCASSSKVRRHRGAGRRRALIPLCAVVGFCFALTEKAKADFIGYYALNNFTLTNSASTNGSAATPDAGQSIVLTGGNLGGGNAGSTDLTIFAAASGMVQFTFSYFSSDPSSAGTYPLGCGLGFVGPCDDAGYLLNGSFVQLADDIHQNSGHMQFSVTSGQSFGFRVETMDNTGGPGILTISAFTAPSVPSDAPAVPEPSTTTVLLGLTAAIVAAQRRMARSKKDKECRS
jgi:hypothetical protein